jgi:hypothetical protein
VKRRRLHRRYGHARRRVYGPPRPVKVDIECPTPREWQWFKRTALEQGWGRTPSDPSFSLELTDRPERLPALFHEAVRAARCKVTVLS